MKKINNFISEKLIINKNIKHHKLNISPKQEEKICNELFNFFQKSTFTYKGETYNNIDDLNELLKKEFNNNLSNFFNYYNASFKILSYKLFKYNNISKNDLQEYIELNNDKLIKEIYDWVL